MRLVAAGLADQPCGTVSCAVPLHDRSTRSGLGTHLAGSSVSNGRLWAAGCAARMRQAEANPHLAHHRHSGTQAAGRIRVQSSDERHNKDGFDVLRCVP